MEEKGKTFRSANANFIFIVWRTNKIFFFSFAFFQSWGNNNGLSLGKREKDTSKWSKKII